MTALPPKLKVLPAIMFVPDVMRQFHFKDPSGALRAIKRGDFGPWFRIGRRYALLRETVLEALRRRAIYPTARPRAADRDGLEPYRRLLFGGKEK